MKIAKFNNQMLPDFFNNCFTKLDNVHYYNTRQKIRAEFFRYSVASESRKKKIFIISVLRFRRMYQKNFVIAHF